MMITAAGSNRMCHMNIWPKLVTLNHAPMPAAFNASFAWNAIHSESKLVCTRYPVNAATIEIRNENTPVIQVRTRCPRQAAIQNLPHRWMTMKKKKNSTLHRWTLLTKCPRDDRWYHIGPFRLNTTPEAMTKTSEAIAPI